MATKEVRKSAKKASSKTTAASGNAQAKYPRHSVERALRIPRAILEQNAGRACTPAEAAGYLGIGFRGPFTVDVSSAIKYGFLARPEAGKIQPTDLARSILRPTNSEDVLRGYRTAVMNAPDISAVYSHYRGENVPDETFFNNALVDTFKIPERDLGDFKQIFFESLETAKLIEKHDDKIRVLDVSTEVPPNPSAGQRVKKLATTADIKAGETCFVMQPFASPHGDYYEKIFKPAIEKTGMKPIRADADIFGTGKIIDQIWRGINAAKVLVAELTTRNANVLYELGLAHALKKPVVLISSNQPDVPFDLKHIRVIYYDVTDPFWGAKLIDKVAENIVSAINNPEEAIFRAIDDAIE
ncbi:MAG: hypothetical protein QOJ51_5838 [Acidobacteriaceae bacterium]|jgi:hypothetical protein|nr:hypothetical protein [Acidobacteriaceae bacterium]